MELIFSLPCMLPAVAGCLTLLSVPLPQGCCPLVPAVCTIAARVLPAGASHEDSRMKELEAQNQALQEKMIMMVRRLEELDGVKTIEVCVHAVTPPLFDV